MTMLAPAEVRIWVCKEGCGFLALSDYPHEHGTVEARYSLESVKLLVGVTVDGKRITEAS